MYRCMGCMEVVEMQGEVCPRCGFSRFANSGEAFQLKPGTILAGRYLVGRVLGSGGFGITYLGYDAALERRLAIKEFLPTMFASRIPGDVMVTVYSKEHTRQFQEGLEGFVKEAGRVAAFHDLPGVVDVYDTIEENGTAYMIMEYLEGQDFKHMLNEHGLMPWETVRDMAVVLCETLEQVHQAGIIHRDISPDNIYFTSDGRLKLIDFGAARYESSRNSKSLSVILKPGYAPEEQYRSHGIQGPFTDVYALAATCYKMLTGITPQDSMERAVADELVPPSRLVPEIPPAFENALFNALAVKADQRTQTAGQFKEDLLSTVTRRVEIKQKRKDDFYLSTRGKLLLGGGLFLAALLALLASTGKLSTGSGNLLKDTFGTGLKEGYVNAPGIVNLSQKEAQELVEQAGLSYLVAGKEYSDKIEKDKVLTQTPLPGRAVEQGSTVEAVICGGAVAEKPAAGEIPDVVYETYEDARAAMEAAGVEAEYVFLYSDTVKAGLIMTQETLGEGRVRVTVSGGSGSLPQGSDFHTFSYMTTRIKDDVVYLDLVSPPKDADNLQVYFEYSLGEDNWQGIKGFADTYTRDYFSSQTIDQPRPLISSDVIMSMFYDDGLSQELSVEIGAMTALAEPPYETERAPDRQKIKLDKTPSRYPAVTIKSVEEYDWNQKDKEALSQVYKSAELETGTPYIIRGDFKKGNGYYLFDGIATWGENRRIPCRTDGELIVISQEPLDAGKILGNLMPLYGASRQEDGSILITAGETVKVDSRFYVLAEGMEEIKGRTVSDGIEQIAKGSPAYRYRLPYRFRFQCDDTIPRGHIIDYVLEQEGIGGEVYRLDLVVSNGKAGELYGDYIVPVQWMPPEGDGTYGQLIYFVLPPDSVPPDIRYVYYGLTPENPENGYYGGEEAQYYDNGLLRGDGSPDGAFYPPEARFVVDGWAKTMEKKGLIQIGDPLYLSMTPAIPNSDVTTGETMKLPVPFKKDLP